MSGQQEKSANSQFLRTDGSKTKSISIACRGCPGCSTPIEFVLQVRRRKRVFGLRARAAEGVEASMSPAIDEFLTMSPTNIEILGKKAAFSKRGDAKNRPLRSI